MLPGVRPWRKRTFICIRRFRVVSQLLGLGEIGFGFSRFALFLVSPAPHEICRGEIWSEPYGLRAIGNYFIEVSLLAVGSASIIKRLGIL